AETRNGRSDSGERTTAVWPSSPSRRSASAGLASTAPARPDRAAGGLAARVLVAVAVVVTRVLPPGEMAVRGLWAERTLIDCPHDGRDRAIPVRPSPDSQAVGTSVDAPAGAPRSAPRWEHLGQRPGGSTSVSAPVGAPRSAPRWEHLGQRPGRGAPHAARR